MKCPECQFESIGGPVFCGECGSSLEMICPNCGSKPPPDHKFCNTCYYDLREHKKSHPSNFEKLQSHIPKHLADKNLTRRSSIESEKKLVTMCFANVAKYTSISENLTLKKFIRLWMVV